MLTVIKKFKLPILLPIVTVISLIVNIYLVFFSVSDEQEGFVDSHDIVTFDESETEAVHVIDDVVLNKKDSLASILKSLGVPENDVTSITNSVNKVYPLKKIVPGNKIIFDDVSKSKNFPHDDEKININQFHILTDNSKVMVRFVAETGTFEAKQVILPLESRVKLISGKVSGNLVSSIKKAGADLRVARDMINLFSYSTDFQREIRSGDLFQVLYEYQVNHEGKVMTKPKLLYSTIVVNGEQKEIFRHVMKSGRVEYFDANGKSMKRALLSTPINGARIGSGFGMRTHPILGYSRMHKGLDYQAPVGTPILASGDGVVKFIKNQAHGYGKHIEIKHNGTYSTLYAHLSRFASGIHPNAKVLQGEVIGYVGTTGMSTGAHLHYEVIQSGQKVNPNKVSFPKVPPLKGAELVKFQANMVKMEKVVAELSTQNKTMVATHELKNKL